MKCGASYNLFNGEEHFLHSLRSVRPELDYVNVVVQYTSNLGEVAPEALREVVDLAKRERLVDEVIEYAPNLALRAQENELRKRRIGLAAAKSSGVEYFLSMDADEYYDTATLADAKRFIICEGFETTAAHTFLHIKRPIWRSASPDTTCVCFLTKIVDQSEFDYGGEFPVLVDPTRRLHGDRQFYMFGQNELTMMHMNLVRKDGLKSKLRNTSSAHMADFILAVQKAYDEWNFGSPLCFPNKPPLKIIEVPDIFGIDQFFRERDFTVIQGALDR